MVEPIGQSFGRNMVDLKIIIYLENRMPVMITYRSFPEHLENRRKEGDHLKVIQILFENHLLAKCME